MEDSILKNIDFGSGGVMLVVSIDDLRALVRDTYEQAARDHARLMEAAAERPALNRTEAAKELGVSMTTLWNWEKSGYLSPVRIGSKALYRRSDINAVLERGTGRAGGATQTKPAATR